MFTDAVYAVDDVFVRTAPGGEAAQLLRSAGLVEGTRNHHPGQGTACRRFFFSNAGSVTSRMARNGVIAFQTGVEHLLELQFDGGCRTTLDFRPGLPLLFRI